MKKLRLDLREFSQAQEAELENNDHKQPYQDMSADWLASEVRKLTARLSDSVGCNHPDKAAEDAVSLGNYAMMVHANCMRRLAAMPKREK